MSAWNKVRSFFPTCRRAFSTKHPKIVLGIETSCDDTGAAVVDETGRVLGEGHSSQMQVHLENGGVIPHIAKYLHMENIENVVASAIKQSGIDLQDISAVAATVKPGLKACLKVGFDYGKKLASQMNKPFIPIHHMEAHTLTIRMVENVEFPFIVLLASGGHCQIAAVENVDNFLLIGTSLHNYPGEVLDKIARRLKLQNLPECSTLSGGQAIEYMARDGNPLAYEVSHSLVAQRNCNFSFAGFGTYAQKIIEEEEKTYDVPPDGVIPNAKHLCASILHGYAIHLVHRLERAFIYCTQMNILPPVDRTLVFSGGVACNHFLRNALQNFCESVDCRLACPPPKLCTDNGIMIAWNGIERLREGVGVYENFEHIETEPDASLGVDLTDDVRKASIKVKVPKLHYPEQQRIES